MLLLVACAAFVACGLAATVIKDIRPLVIWHGLGDSYASPGLLQFEEEIRKMHPGIFTHIIYLDEDAKADERATFYGNVNEQIALAAAQLASIPELSNGFDGIGFSQGGQFLRAYVERYNNPPLYNLITFGSQHMGISDIPECRTFDFLCQVARQAVKAGVYTQWAQEHLVQAQYFRDSAQLEVYMASSSFLADINNEVPFSYARNATYAKNLASLKNLVLVLFREDQTVIPKESAWFGSEALPEESQVQPSRPLSDSPHDQYPLDDHSTVVDKTIIPMREHPLYLEDYIGLRSLDERGAITLVTCEGRHMHLTGCWEDLAEKWLGQPFPK